jgi:hypothetical protein
MTTRREVLISASCAALAATAPLSPAFGAINTRRNILDVENDPGALQALRDAVDVLRKKDDYGRRPAIDGWFALATTHNQLCFGASGPHEIHYGWWFLPWHRAYLVHVERTLQDAINEPSLTIPYWDWLTTPTLPKSVFERTYRKAGATLVNPLFDDQRFGPVGQGAPINFIDLGAPGKSEQELIAVDTFDNFAGGRPDDAHTRRPGYLEATPHTYIHRAVGYDQVNNRVGLMTVGMAPLDPVFFLHHANVDRLWTVWLSAGGRRANPDDPAWREHRFAFPETKKFKLVDYRIADLLDTTASAGRYRYDRGDIAGPVTNAGTLVLRGVPISTLPITIRVFAERTNAATFRIGSISTIPSQANGKMDAVLPITDAMQPFFADSRPISIRAVVAGTDAPVTFDGFAIDLPR